MVRNEAGAVLWAVLLQGWEAPQCPRPSLHPLGTGPDSRTRGTLLSQPQPAAQVLLLAMSGVPDNTPSAPDGVQRARPRLFPKGRGTTRLLSPQGRRHVGRSQHRLPVQRDRSETSTEGKEHRSANQKGYLRSACRAAKHGAFVSGDAVIQ